MSDEASLGGDWANSSYLSGPVTLVAAMHQGVLTEVLPKPVGSRAKQCWPLNTRFMFFFFLKRVNAIQKQNSQCQNGKNHSIGSLTNGK